MTVRGHVLTRLVENKGDDLVLRYDPAAIDDEIRYLAVTILDDDTQPYREIQAFRSEACATDYLCGPATPETMRGEFLITLDAKTLDACMRPVAFDVSDRPGIGDCTVAFDESVCPFA